MDSCTFPTKPPHSPLRLSSNYRDYFGDPYPFLVELIDPIINSGCYVPRIFHAPETYIENAGVGPNGYHNYTLVVPPGSFLLGFLHSFTSAPSANITDPPVASGFRMQLTDMKSNHKLFAKPVPEAWFLNDIPSANPQDTYADTLLNVQNQTPRLLPAPYPVIPPGIFKVEFWNILQAAGVAVVNKFVRMSFVVAIPDPDMKAGKTW